MAKRNIRKKIDLRQMRRRRANSIATISAQFAGRAIDMYICFLTRPWPSARGTGARTMAANLPMADQCRPQAYAPGHWPCGRARTLSSSCVAQ